FDLRGVFALATPHWHASFFYDCSAAHLELHSFPTRRSSDLDEQSRAVEREALSPIVGQYRALQKRGVFRKDIRAEVLMSLRNTPDRKSTRLNSSHVKISYAVFCLKKKKNNPTNGLPRTKTTS